jgi:hypothetical protein
MGTLRHLASGILLGLAVAVFSMGGATAAKEVALTEDSVSRFLASFGEMRIIAVSEGLKASTDPDATNNPVAAVIKAIKSSKLQKEAKTVAVKHGFLDMREWADTGKAIGQAYLYVTTGPSRGVAKATLDKHKDNAMKQLEKLGVLNEKQKQKLRENLDDASDQLSREPPPENVAVVKQMKPDIDAALKFGVN